MENIWETDGNSFVGKKPLIMETMGMLLDRRILMGTNTIGIVKFY